MLESSTLVRGLLGKAFKMTIKPPLLVTEPPTATAGVPPHIGGTIHTVLRGPGPPEHQYYGKRGAEALRQMSQRRHLGRDGRLTGPNLLSPTVSGTRKGSATVQGRPPPGRYMNSNQQRRIRGSGVGTLPHQEPDGGNTPRL